MNSFYHELQQALSQGKDVMLATAVDCLVEFSCSYDMLIAQKAFRCDNELTAQTPSMKEFWMSVCSAASEQLPDVFAQDSWWAFFDPMGHPFPADSLSRLAAGEQLVMATVIAKAETLPQLAGVKLAVTPEGELWGTLGDSNADDLIVKTAQSVLEEYVPRLLEFELEGMPLRILLEPVN